MIAPTWQYIALVHTGDYILSTNSVVYVDAHQLLLLYQFTPKATHYIALDQRHHPVMIQTCHIEWGRQCARELQHAISVVTIIDHHTLATGQVLHLGNHTQNILAQHNEFVLFLRLIWLLFYKTAWNVHYNRQCCQCNRSTRPLH